MAGSRPRVAVVWLLLQTRKKHEGRRERRRSLTFVRLSVKLNNRDF